MFQSIKESNKTIQSLTSFQSNYNKVTDNISNLKNKKRIYDSILSKENLEQFEVIKSKMSLYRSSKEMVKKHEDLSLKINKNRTELERCKLITDKKIAAQIKSINEKKEALVKIQNFFSTCKSQIVSYNEVKNSLKAKQEEIDFFYDQIAQLEKLKSMKTFECSSCGTVNLIGEEVE